MNITLFKLGRALRSLGVPYYIVDRLPHRVFSGWVDAELRINARYYVQYNQPDTAVPKGWAEVEADDPWDRDPNARAETTVFMGDRYMTL